VNKYKSYKAFNEAKTKCTLCSLSNERKQVVCSDGCKKPVIMVVGEAPGADEDEQGVPFIGKAGKRLRSTLENFGITKKNSIITNVIPCRPPKNAFPKDKELVANCFHSWLWNEIRLTKPKYLLLLGNQPLKMILNLNGITKHRGILYPLYDPNGGVTFWAMPTFHPSYIERKQYMEDGEQIIEWFEEDIKKLAGVAGIDN